jgi:hypothetical protein
VQVYGKVHGRVRWEERPVGVSHEATGIHGTAVGVGRAPIDVPRRHVKALGAADLPDRLHALRRRVDASARRRSGEPRCTRHRGSEVPDQRPRRVREPHAGHCGSVAELRVPRERGLVVERRALVADDAAVEDDAPAVGHAAGGAEPLGGGVEAGDAVAAGDVRAALRHRERRRGGARLRGGGEPAAGGEVGAELGERGVERGLEGRRGRGVVLAAPLVEQRGLRVGDGGRGPRGGNRQRQSRHEHDANHVASPARER